MAQYSPPSLASHAYFLLGNSLVKLLYPTRNNRTALVGKRGVVMTFAREKPSPEWMICEYSRLVASLDHAISLARRLEQSLTSWLQKVFQSFDDSHPFPSKIFLDMCYE